MRGSKPANPRLTVVEPQNGGETDPHEEVSDVIRRGATKIPQHHAAIRRTEFRRFMASQDLHTNRAIADHLGLGEGTISRLLDKRPDRDNRPGAAVLIAFAKKHPTVPLSMVFDLDAPPPRRNQDAA